MAALSVSGVLVSALPAAAQSEPPAMRISDVSESAEALRDAVLDALAECDGGALVVRLSVEFPEETRERHRLAAALVAPTLERLRADPRFERAHLASFGRVDVHPAQVAARLGYDVMVDLRIRADGGFSSFEGEAWTTADEMRRGAFSLRRRLDVALRRHLGFPPRLVAEEVRARAMIMPGRDYLAFAVQDLDGDGTVEIIALLRDEAQVMRMVEVRGRERPRIVGRARYPEDLSRHPSPRRRRVASAMARERSVVGRTSDFVEAIDVDLQAGTVVVRAVEGPCDEGRYPMLGGCAALVPGRDYYDEILTRHAGSYEEAPLHFYSYAFARYESREGVTTEFEALTSPLGRLSLRTRRSPPEDGAESVDEGSAGAAGYGAPLAMADVDVDGTAELLLSHAAPAGRGDQISLLRALPRGALHVLWRSDPLAGSVWAVTAGDIDGDGLDELLAIEEPAGEGRATLWVVE